MTLRFLVICASLLQDPDDGIATFRVWHNQVNIGGEVWDGANDALEKKEQTPMLRLTSRRHSIRTQCSRAQLSMTVLMGSCSLAKE